MISTSTRSSPGASSPGDGVRRSLLAIALALLLSLSFGAAADDAEMRDSREYFFIQTFGDLPEELQLAREEGKLGMLLFFEAEACPYCQYMHRKVLSRKDVQDFYRERFVNIAVDIHGDVKLTDLDGITLPSKVFADHRRVFMTPVVAFLDLDGNEIYRHLGMIRTPEEFLLLGEYIDGEHYFDTEYKIFAKARGMGDDDAVSTPAGESE